MDNAIILSDGMRHLHLTALFISSGHYCTKTAPIPNRVSMSFFMGTRQLGI